LGVGGRKRVKGRIKKARGENQRIYIRRSIRKGGLEGIDKRVGSRGKKVKKKEKGKAHGLRSMGLLLALDFRPLVTNPFYLVADNELANQAVIH